MKRLTIILTCFLISWTVKGQIEYLKYPDYDVVISKFFDKYSIKNIPSTAQVKFEKRPTGWHITVIDYSADPKTIKDEIFWNRERNKFKEIDFEKLKIKGENQEQIDKFQKDWSKRFYSICPYYGYPSWDWDVIQEFKDANNLPDSTLYALGRAYSSYASNLLNNNSGLADSKHQFDLPQGRNCMTSEQLEKYRYYRHLAIEKFKKVTELNPKYETIVGAIGIKTSNEQLTSFLDMRMYQNEQEANKEIIAGLYTDFYLSTSKNFLNSCAPNAILFTNGDNDTYPLLYVQAKYGFRTDVLIVNMSLLQTDRYINSLREQILDAPGLPIPSSLEHDDYRTGTRDYTPIQERVTEYIEVKDVVDFINSNNPKAKLNTSAGLRNYCPTKNLKITVNKEIAKTFVPKEYHDQIVDEVKFNLTGSGIFKNKLLVLDILANFNWERPVYFAITVGRDNYMGLEKYFQLEGLAYRLVPYSVASPDGQTGIVHTEKMYERLMNQFKWGGLNNPELYFDETNTRMVMNFTNNYARLAESLFQKGDTIKAIAVLDKCLNEFPQEVVNFSYFTIPIIDLYYKLGQNKKGDQVLATMIDNYITEIKYLKEFDSGSGLSQDIGIAGQILGSLGRVLQIHKLEDLSYSYTQEKGIYYRAKEGKKEKIDFNTYRINTFMKEYISIQ